MSTNKKMGCKPYISVVIAFYKRLDFLGLILDCLDKQSEKRFEVIIAEDDNAQETLDFIKHKKRQVRYPIKHVFQEDLGFRKNRALNRALLIASSDIIAFLDGDCLPHKHFVKQHIKNVREGLSCFGRRVMLGEKISNKMIAHGCRGYLGLITLLMSDSKKWRKRFTYPLIFA